jgi:mediator of RNA polymerase II transcription subunit 17
MATISDDSDQLIFPHRQHTRLRVSITLSDGTCIDSANALSLFDKTDLSGSLQVAQQEIVEQEIFSLLVKEAADLPTAMARVSERTIFIDAAPGMELHFELVRCSFYV